VVPIEIDDRVIRIGRDGDDTFDADERVLPVDIERQGHACPGGDLHLRAHDRRVDRRG
jgi:hypothetical protein